jgi:hypothetical protein
VALVNVGGIFCKLILFVSVGRSKYFLVLPPVLCGNLTFHCNVDVKFILSSLFFDYRPKNSQECYLLKDIPVKFHHIGILFVCSSITFEKNCSRTTPLTEFT